MIKKILSNSFAKSVLILSSATFLSSILGLIIMPIITRIYTPSELGVLTFILSTVAMLSIGTFKYEMVLPKIDSKKESLSILFLSYILLSLFIVILIILFFLNSYINIVNLEFSHFIFIILGIFFSANFEILRYYSLSLKKFSLIARASIVQSIIANTSKLSIGFLGYTTYGLIIGWALGLLFGVITFCISFGLLSFYFMKNVKLKYLKKVAYKHKQFPIYQAPIFLLTRAGQHLPIIIIAYLYTATDVGYYGLAATVVLLPVILIGRAIGDVYYTEISKYYKKDIQYVIKLSQKLLIKLTILGILIFPILILFGEEMFSFIFGNNWAQAGVYASILSFYMLIRFIFAPISRVFETFDKQKEKLSFNILKTLLIIILFFYALLDSTVNVDSFITYYTTIMSLYYIIMFLRSRIILNNYSKSITYNKKGDIK